MHFQQTAVTTKAQLCWIQVFKWLRFRRLAYLHSTHTTCILHHRKSHIFNRACDCHIVLCSASEDEEETGKSVRKQKQWVYKQFACVYVIQCWTLELWRKVNLDKERKNRKPRPRQKLKVSDLSLQCYVFTDVIQPLFTLLKARGGECRQCLVMMTVNQVIQ